MNRNKPWMNYFLTLCMALTLVPTAALATEELDTMPEEVVAEAPEIAEAVVDAAEAPEVAQMNEETAAAKLEEITVETPSETTAALNKDEDIIAEAPEIAEMEVDTADLLEPVEEADAPEEMLEAKIVASGYCGNYGDDLPWQLDSDGLLIISGHGAMRNYSYYEYYPWYKYRSDIKTIRIEDGVTTIENWAFDSGYTNLTKVTIGNSVTKIGQSAFYNCTALKELILPSSLKTVEYQAFYGCKNLTTVYYGGSQSDWVEISINQTGNSYLIYNEDIRYNSKGSTDYSNVVPKVTSVTISPTGLTVNWNAVNSLSLYRVYRRTAGTSWTKLKDVAATSYTDTTAVNGKKYYYTVRGMLDTEVVTNYDKTGLSATYYSAPRLLGILKVSDGLVPVWNGIPGITKYRIYRKVSGGSWTALKDVTTTSYIDTTAKSGTTYYYTVRGMNGTVIVTGYNKTGVSAKR